MVIDEDGWSHGQYLANAGLESNEKIVAAYEELIRLKIQWRENERFLLKGQAWDLRK